MPLGRGVLSRMDSVIAAVQRLPPRASVAREMRLIRRGEVYASTALAGSRLRPEEVDALIDHGRANGNHAFDDYRLVRAYADAARVAAEFRPYPAGDRRPLLALDELRMLNARAISDTGLRGGAWRQGNPPPGSGGIVAPAAWLVAQEVTALLDRFGRGPGDDRLEVWLARFLGRFARLIPFEGGNGRTARLAANAMLRRLDIVPLVFSARDRARYAAALGAAQANAPAELAQIIAGAIVRTSDRLIAAASEADGALEPLRRIARSDYTALAKAAQRGRLRSVVRSGRYFTTPEWIAEYRSGLASRAR